MKQIYLTMLFALCTVCTSAWAQEHRPLLEEGKTWRVAWWSMNLPYSHVYDYAVMGDTIVGGKTWKKVYCIGHTDIEKGTRTAYTDRPYRIMREEDGRVYFLRSTVDTEGALLMDTQWTEGDVLRPYIALNDYLGTKESVMAEWDVCVKDVGEIMNCGHTYRTWTLEYVNQDKLEENGISVRPTTWIEGVGEESHGLSNNGLNSYYMDSRGSTLMECRVGDDILYKKDFPALEQLLEAVSIVSPATSENAPIESFDLQGRRLTQEPQRGVFIRDGRKVVKGK